MSSEFTHKAVMKYFYQVSFLEIDVNVFQAIILILSIQRIFDLIKNREVIIKNSHNA